MVSLARALRIDGWMEPEELIWLAERARACRTVIEVGSFLGRSARVIAEACPGTLYCVDTWRGFDGQPDPTDDAYYLTFLRNMGDLISDGRVLPIRTDSLLWTPDLQADMIFLDGGHDEARVSAEIFQYGRLLRRGGLLCGHDYNNREHPGVRAAVDACVPGAQAGPKSIWWHQVPVEEEGWC